MRGSTLLLSVPLALSVGCTGTIDGTQPDESATGAPNADQRPRPQEPARPPATTGPGPSTTTPPGPVVPASPSETACKPGERAELPLARIWRLSPAQFANTVKQIFGAEVDVGVLPVDGVTDDSITRFSTNAESNVVNDRMAMAYRDQAERIAGTYTASLGAGPHKCLLDATASDACVKGFAEDVASKAFRRPVTADEAGRLVTLYKALRADVDGPAAARGVITAVIQSPFFLYRTELGTGAAGARVALTPYEIAAQISYMVADLPPDAALWTAAGKGELTTPAQVRPHVERLLDAATARAKVKDFFSAYLHLDSPHEKDAAKFPTFNETLKKALTGETNTFIEKTLFEGGSIETLFSAQHSFLNATVAKHYGMTMTGSEYQRATLPMGRQGLLSHASVLSALSAATLTSPVHRGLFYSQGMLCRALPAPPADAQNQGDKLFDPDNPDATEREKWAYFQRTSAACAACHRVFHPLGLGLENFDPIGRWRDSEFGKSIDPSVEVTGVGQGVDGSYRHGLEVARAIITSDVGRACFSMQYATYALGRTIGSGEQCRLESFAQRLAQGNMTLSSLVVAVAEDEGFFFRRYE